MVCATHFVSTLYKGLKSMAQNGIDLYKIAKLLGHKDIKTTQRYAHHCTESLRDGVDILSAV